jgi:hypothetical protein
VDHQLHTLAAAGVELIRVELLAQVELAAAVLRVLLAEVIPVLLVLQILAAAVAVHHSKVVQLPQVVMVVQVL